MNTYTVKSGELNISVRALTKEIAIYLAVINNIDAKLGQIMSVKKLEDSEDNEVYVSSERILKDLGFTVKG